MIIEKMGYAGGLGGQAYRCILPPSARINEVHVFANQYVEAVQIFYSDEEGNIAALPKIGGGGGKRHILRLDGDEHITAISGENGWYVDCLRFHTNKRVSQTYGGDGGFDEYRIDIPAGMKMVGLYGKSDWYVDALGLLISEV